MMLVKKELMCSGKAIQTIDSTIIELWIIDRVLNHFKVGDGQSISISKLIARELYRLREIKKASREGTDIFFAYNSQEMIEYTNELVEKLQEEAERILNIQY